MTYGFRPENWLKALGLTIPPSLLLRLVRRSGRDPCPRSVCWPPLRPETRQR